MNTLSNQDAFVKIKDDTTNQMSLKLCGKEAYAGDKDC